MEQVKKQVKLKRQILIYVKGIIFMHYKFIKILDATFPSLIYNSNLRNILKSRVIRELIFENLLKNNQKKQTMNKHFNF